VVLLHEGATAEADEQFEAARSLRWWDPEVSALAGHAYAVAGRTTGDPDQLAHADRWLRERLGAGHPPAAVLADLGLVREAGGDLPGAAALLDRALDADPHNPEYLLQRGVVAARQEDWRTAESAFLDATRGAPDSPAPWENLARIYGMTGRADDARRADARGSSLRE
jgi:tetratricopeptide (TPR) repeat protein